MSEDRPAPTQGPTGGDEGASVETNTNTNDAPDQDDNTGPEVVQTAAEIQTQSPPPSARNVDATNNKDPIPAPGTPSRSKGKATSPPPGPVIDPATEAAVAPRTPTKKKSSAENVILGYGNDYPEKLYTREELRIEVKGGTIIEIKLNKSVIVTYVPELVGDKLLLGDWLRAVNGTVIDSRKKGYSLLKKCQSKNNYVVVLTVKRPVKTVMLSTEKQVLEHLPPAVEVLPGNAYLLGFVSTYAGAKVGLFIKSYENKVYVSSIGQGSLAESTFFVGDIILSVDDIAVASVSEAHKRISTALQTKKWMQCVIERAESKVALQRMNLALKADRKLEIDARMTEDVIQIVTTEVARMKKDNNSKPTSILKGASARTHRVSFSSHSKETPIQCDPVNFKLLIKVPPNRPGAVLNRRRSPLGRVRQSVMRRGYDFGQTPSSTTSSSTTTTGRQASSKEKTQED
uniref:PDZ domain-containing protein n=1 Tax=Panagrellus redivivus TaxID=6233 RepID=A0A7E4W581_PANRE